MNKIVVFVKIWVLLGLLMMSHTTYFVSYNQTDKKKFLLKKWKLVDADFPEIEKELSTFSPEKRKQGKQKLKKLFMGSFIEFQANEKYSSRILGDSAQGSWQITHDFSALLIKNNKDTAATQVPIIELTRNSLIFVGKENQKFYWQPF